MGTSTKPTNKQFPLSAVPNKTMISETKYGLPYSTKKLCANSQLIMNMIIDNMMYPTRIPR